MKKKVNIKKTIAILLILIVGLFVLGGCTSSTDNFPNQIVEYTLKSKNTNDKSKCGELEDNNVCIQMGRFEYVGSNNQAVHILPTKIISGKDGYINYIKSHYSEKDVDGISGVYRGSEPWELYWFTNRGYDMISTQDYKYLPQADGSIKSQALNATTHNSVTKWLLEHYPPISN